MLTNLSHARDVHFKQYEKNPGNTFDKYKNFVFVGLFETVRCWNKVKKKNFGHHNETSFGLQIVAGPTVTFYGPANRLSYVVSTSK